MTFTLEDYLVKLHSGSWFVWSDSNNKVYANFNLATKMMNDAGDLIDNLYSKPSESDCTSGVAALQSDYDALNYSRLRRAKYDLLNQDEMRFDDQVNSTTTWVDAINAIKVAHPKP